MIPDCQFMRSKKNSHMHIGDRKKKCFFCNWSISFPPCELECLFAFYTRAAAASDRRYCVFDSKGSVAVTLEECVGLERARSKVCSVSIVETFTS